MNDDNYCPKTTKLDRSRTRTVNYRGDEMHSWASDLFPICRSLTGPGVRETLRYIQRLLPGLTIHEVPSGTEVFDWTVPEEWTIEDAFIANAGERIVDFNKNNLHVVGYSVPVDAKLSLRELDAHLFSLPEQPTAIPYVTSYYSRDWGFCLSHEQRLSLKDITYHVVIRSKIEPGVLNFADLIVPGESEREVMLSTYICHPSMANNELSGPIVTTAIAQWLKSVCPPRHTYRFVFIPETIGSIVYLSRNLQQLKKNVVAGYNVTCVGDDRSYSFLPSRNGATLSDIAALHVLKHIDPNFKRYTWLDRGGDERQYCSPGVDLPIATIMRSKFAEYPEYHTSLDDLTLVTPEGLQGAYTALRRSIEIIENNTLLKNTTLCEPFLNKRGLYPQFTTHESRKSIRVMMNLLTFCDGTRSLLDIAELIGSPFWDIFPIAESLELRGLLEVMPDSC